MHNYRIIIPAALAALWLTVGAAGIEPVNPNLNPTARQVLNYLDSVYGKKMLAGYNVYVHTPDDYEQTGKQAAVWAMRRRWSSTHGGTVTY